MGRKSDDSDMADGSESDGSSAGAKNDDESLDEVEKPLEVRPTATLQAVSPQQVLCCACGFACKTVKIHFDLKLCEFCEPSRRAICKALGSAKQPERMQFDEQRREDVSGWLLRVKSCSKRPGLNLLSRDTTLANVTASVRKDLACSPKGCLVRCALGGSETYSNEHMYTGLSMFVIFAGGNHESHGVYLNRDFASFRTIVFVCTRACVHLRVCSVSGLLFRHACVIPFRFDCPANFRLRLDRFS